MQGLFSPVSCPSYAHYHPTFPTHIIRFSIARSHVKSLQFSITKLTPCQAALQSMQRKFLRRTNKNNWGKSATCDGRWCRGCKGLRGHGGSEVLKMQGVLAPMAIFLLLPDCLMTAAPHCTALFNPSSWHCTQKLYSLINKLCIL